MAYRVNTQFKDGSTDSLLSDVIAGPSPRFGETISVSRHGQDVPVLVTAVWTPSASKPQGRNAGVLVVVEAREI